MRSIIVDQANTGVMGSTAALVLLAVFTVVFPGARGQCQQGWKFFYGNCYKFVASDRSFVGEPVTATWTDARLVCLSLGGDLVSIHTPAENEFVRSKSTGDIWIGYTESRSRNNRPFQFQWTDGTSTSYDYMNWAHRQPHYTTTIQHLLGCTYQSKGLLNQKKRAIVENATTPPNVVQQPRHHQYGQPGQWYATGQCSTDTRRYVCKRPASCYDMRIAVADLVPNMDTGVSGTVTFQQYSLGGSTLVKGILKGLTPHSKHGIHIHTSSDKSKACLSYGGHYNPYGRLHGSRKDGNRHVGDLGNIMADENGVASFTMHEESLVSLFGPTTVVGRGVVIHAGEDDLGRGGNTGSLRTGNAGGRLACGPIICRTCFDTLSAVANVKSDDGKDHGHFVFYQEYQMGFTKELVGFQTITAIGPYNHAQFVIIQHEEFVKKGRKCDALFTSDMMSGPTEHVSSGRLEGNKIQRRSFSTTAITSFIGKVAAYQLSHRTVEGEVTESVTLCGTVWPAPYEKCACVILQTTNGPCGELCFRQQNCGGPVSIEGSIGELCLSADNDAAGFSAMDYAIPADQCMDADYDQIMALPLQRNSNGTVQVCSSSVGLSLREPSSLAGRTFLLHDSDGDPVSCGVTEYRATCPKSSCQLEL